MNGGASSKPSSTALSSSQEIIFPWRSFIIARTSFDDVFLCSGSFIDALNVNCGAIGKAINQSLCLIIVKIQAGQMRLFWFC